MSTLRIFLDDASFPFTTLSEVGWRMLDASPARRGRSTLADLPHARKVEVFLPPSLAFRHSVTLPPGGKRQARKLLPHALDTVLLGEPGDQHFAYTIEGDRCNVVSVERTLIDSVLKTLAERKIRPQAMYIADALIPADGSVLLWYGQGWARRVGHDAQWFDTSEPTTCPALLRHRLGPGDQLTLVFGIDAVADVELMAWQDIGAVAVGHGDALAAPVQADAVNLLQGEFAAGPQIDIDYGRLRPTVTLAAAALVIFLLVWFGQWFAWRSEEKALNRSMAATYAAAFPGEPQIDSALLVERLRQKARARSAGGATDAVARLVSVAGKLHAPGGAQLVSLEFKPGRIEAEYLAKPEQLQALTQALSGFGQASVHPVGSDHAGLSLILH